MTHPKFAKTKVYEVQLDRPLEPLNQQMISDYGVQLEDGVSKFTVIRQEEGSKDVPAASLISSRSLTAQAKHLQPEFDKAPRPLLEPGAKPFGEGGEGRGEVKKSNPYPIYQITMREGRNRQIRRTFEALREMSQLEELDWMREVADRSLAPMEEPTA
jgi:16S rRNA U516 pseudouridylate synthase RsuA-like enzyme